MLHVMELLVNGAVQGVGFRPLVYRVAHQMGLGGAVWNEPGGVRVRLVGPARRVAEFSARLRAECMPPARIDTLRTLSIGTTECAEPFRIVESMNNGARDALVMPDLATCPACLRELFDPRNRRFRYPFINCTHCGPRFSIITGIPYDRPQTTMRDFAMCAECEAEYNNPEDRRFHAQPNACPQCGPQVELLDASGARLGGRDWAIRQTVIHLRDGKIVAVKGIGGFHLICLARHPEAVAELRRRKQREEKPLAVMVPDIETARRLAELSTIEEDLLATSAAPIVLLRRRKSTEVADGVAPNNPFIGLMLPYSPLHHLILRALEAPVVATSGNLSDEPICTDEHDAVQRLAGIADFFLVHNRPIARPLDDSVARIAFDRAMLLRRARGYAPLALPLPEETSPILALGSHLKNTVALAMRDRIVISQHLGDLDTLESRRAFEQAVADLQQLYGEQPETWVTDLHPDYASTQYAHEQGRHTIRVQHHHAHIAAVMAEHGLTGPALGFAWDGTGLGDDGTIWGGEVFRAQPGDFLRIGHVSAFHLPGGDAAMRKPIHSAFGALYACFPEQMPDLAIQRLGLDPETARNLQTLIERRQNAPLTSSVGRWFDAIAALCGVCRVSTYEGMAAQRLEHCMDEDSAAWPYPFETRVSSGVITYELKSMLRDILTDLDAGVPAARTSTRFHMTLIEIIVRTAGAHRGMPVILSGGCFQNRFLLDTAIERLRAAEHTVYWPQLVPPNDGGIALGQAYIARNSLAL